METNLDVENLKITIPRHFPGSYCVKTIEFSMQGRRMKKDTLILVFEFIQNIIYKLHIFNE